MISLEDVKLAQRRLALGARLIAEPSGAVAFAAFLFHQQELSDTRRSVAVISGGNVAPETLAQILAE